LEPNEIQAVPGRKQAIHFGAPHRPLFGFYHPPSAGVWRDTAVLLCNPLGTDQTRSDRTYRRLAERIGGAGFPCLRFDLFGTGDSGGDEFAPALVRAWLDDIALATDEVRARCGARQIALVGLRFGATLALAHAAERGDVDSLVLWSPCISGKAFVDEVVKLHKVYARIEPQLALAPPAGADGEEALGLFLPRALVEEIHQIDLLQIARRPARQTLVIDGGNLVARDALLSHLREIGASPVLRSHPGHKFLVNVSHRAQVPEDVIDSIVEWLGATHPASVGTPDTSPRPPGVAPAGERPLWFGGTDRPRLFGIFTPGEAALRRPEYPAIVLTSAGAVPTVFT
jgi:pimeloyl-ACP methyl ester carboxylesterase